MTTLSPVHPGEILMEEFMEPLGLSASELARRMGVPVNRVTNILHHARSITADTAIRLSILFGTTAEFWLNLQSRFELETAHREMDQKIMRAVKPLKKELAHAC